MFEGLPRGHFRAILADPPWRVLANDDIAAFWRFAYKTCAFVWAKADGAQLEMFRDDIDPFMGMGYWTRANTEVCLLATRGNPKRLNADVRQAIIEPRREHSRKPDCVYERIERLVDGPYLELFARTRRPGWTSWGNEVDKFAGPRQWQAESRKDYDPADDMTRSLEDCYAAVRERKAAGGPGWPQEETFADRVIREGNALARKLKHFR